MTLATVALHRGNIEKETEKAWLIDAGMGGFWVPKSQTSIFCDNPDERSAVWIIALPVWLAKKKGLWGYNSFGERIAQLIEEIPENWNEITTLDPMVIGCPSIVEDWN